MMRKQACGGYSLVEVVVSLALLATVLAPMTAASVYFIKQNRNEQEIAALALARSYMEQTIYEEQYVERVYELEKGKWIVERLIDRDGVEVAIRIRVYYRRASSPTIQLMTVRLSR